MNLLETLDLISPKLTLFYRGKESHSSRTSGVISILANAVIVAISIYFSLDFFCHENPTAFYFNKFIEDAGVFPLNSSMMFHFFQLSLENNEIDIVDFDAIEIIGLQELIGTYIDNNNLELYDHWMYGNCDNSDVQGIEDLITLPNFEQSGCIKKFYNHTEKKYYTPKDPEFIYPTLLRGCSHPNRTFYGIMIERCRNHSLRERPCKKDEEIDQYISTHVGLEMELIDNFIDVTNYKDPYTKYFYKITNGFSSSTYTVNHLNFNPSSVKTHNGFMFDNIYEEKSYIFDQNEKQTDNSEKTGIYCSFYFWMQNRIQLYERTYKRIQDIIASVGGTTKLISVIASCLNFLYNKFVVYLDTEEILNHISSMCLNNSAIIKTTADVDKSADKSQTQVSQNNFVNNNPYNYNNFFTPGSTNKINAKIKNINTLTTVPSFVKKKKKKKESVSFYAYIINFLKIKNNKDVNIIERFRMRVCSEENLIKSYINLYRVNKVTDKDGSRSFLDENEFKNAITTS